MKNVFDRLKNLPPEKRILLEQQLEQKRKANQQERQIQRQSGSGPFPLSFAQERLWFLDQLEPGNAAYNLPARIQLRGRLDIAGLEHSLNTLVERHQILRTIYTIQDGQPVQYIQPFTRFPLTVTKIDGEHEDAREAAILRLAAAEASKPFDLEHGPLFRMRLLETGSEEHILLLTFHHIAFDGWSAGLFNRELTLLYRAYCAAEPTPLSDLSIQYVDYAVEQRQWLQGERLEQQLAYWQEQLADISSAALELPTDYPRPAVQRFRGARYEFSLPSNLAEALKSLCRSEDVTLFMLLLSAFYTLLYHYTHQSDISIGTPLANRRSTDVEGLIGLFVNTLVLRGDLSSNPRFRQLLKRVREMCLEAYNHQDIPFEKIVEKLQPERNLSYNPLFQVIFALQNVPKEALALPGLSIDTTRVDAKTTMFDLRLLLMDGAEGLGGALEYNSDLFARATVEHMVMHFQTLLEGIVADPDQRVAELNLLTEHERHLIMEEWNTTTSEYHAELCLQEQFEAQAARQPDAIAVQFADQVLSYQMLNERATHLAWVLQRYQVGPETIIGISMERSIALIVAVLGILKAGAAYLPLDSDYPQERLNLLIEDARVKLVLTDRRSGEKIARANAQVLCCDDIWDENLAAVDERNTGVRPENLAYVIYTSGSTGTPKGVMINHAHVVRLFLATRHWFNFSNRDSWTLFHSYAFDFSVWELWGALLHGGRLVIVPYWVTRTPALFYTLLKEQAVTVLNQTPSAFTQLLQLEMQEQQANDLFLRTIIFGGEALQPHLLKPWLLRHEDKPLPFVNMYGITETTVHVTYYPVKPTDILERGRSIIGAAIPDLQLYILNPSLHPTPVGVAGELYIGGAGLARGYLFNPDLTASRFIPDPFSHKPGMRLYRTGDLARYLPGGDIEYVGRADSQVKIRGFRIELGEIEAAFARHPDVQEALVLLRQDAPGDKRLAAYVVLKPGVDLSPSSLRRYLQGLLPAYMVPAFFITLPALPLTAHGKVDRLALPPPMEARLTAESTYIAPGTSVEVQLARIWSEVLGVERVGIHDNFFELGGDSLRTIQIKSLAQKAGIFFSVQQLFQHQSIAELVSVLQEEQPLVDNLFLSPFQLITEEDLHSLPPELDDAYPMTLLQMGMVFHSRYSQLPGGLAYHDVFSFRVQGSFDADILRQTIQLLLVRHPILRTSFELSRYSEPLQLVHKAVPVPLQVQDIRLLSPEEQNAVLHKWTQAQQQHIFELEQAPLFHIQAHIRTDGSFQVTLSFHHAILDGWSVASLVTELLQTYKMLFTGENSLSHTAPATSFRDFVYYEHQALGWQECKNFWQSMLENYTQTTIPYWQPADMAQEQTLLPQHRVAFSDEIMLGLKRLARSAMVPLKSVLLAAHLRVMSVLSGQIDVVTGLVSNGRIEGNDGEQVLGLFLNTVPLRLKLSGGTWEALVRQVFAAEQAIWPYRRYPLAQIQKDMGGVTLFDVYFDYRHFHVYQRLEELENFKIVDGEFFERTNFTLAANFNHALAEEKISLALKYDPTRLTRSQVVNIGQYYTRALTAIASQPSERYEMISLLTENEWHCVINQWNNTTVDSLPDRCIHELFEEQVERAPDAIAAAFDDVQLTYRDLNRRANQVAGLLQQRGITPEMPVGLLLERSLDMLTGILGILKAGGAYVPLDPKMPKERLKFILVDARIGLVLSQEQFSNELAQLPVQTFCLDLLREEFAREVNTRHAVSPHNLAYVIYTSGSTGKPKGVMANHRNVVNFFAGMDKNVGDDAYAHWLAVTSISFDISVLELLWTLTRGYRVIIHADQQVRQIPSLKAPAHKAAQKVVDFSLFYFANNAEMAYADDKYRLLMESAKFADQHGFSAVWTPERHFHAFGGLYPNPSVISAALAAVTERVAIRAGSVVLPLHNPLRVAEEWSVVDNLSRGRVGLSFASGWHANDFVLAPEQYATRRETMAQNIEVVRKLWRGEAVSCRNGVGNEVEVKIFPLPTQAELPIWITSTGSPETFKLAGEMGANLLTHLLGQSVEELGEKIVLYRRAWQEHGHPGEGKVTLMLHTFVGLDEAMVREQVRQPLCTYLESSWNLIQALAEGLGYGKDRSSITAEDMDTLLAYAFDRYYQTSGLLGTPEACLAMIDRLKAIGVNEVACLIDFGVDVDAVLASLPFLEDVMRQSQEREEADLSYETVAAQIRTQDISHLQITPSLAQILLAEPEAPEALGQLQKLLLGGETLPVTLANQLNDVVTGSLYNMYGPTETTIWSTNSQVLPGATTISIGHPIANTQCYILDSHLQPVPPGVAGNLYIGGTGVTRGYLNRPDLTAERFIPDPFSSQPGTCLYQTGDIARYLQDGSLDLLGRNDYQVKIKGYRIELGEIEAELKKQPIVREAVVLAREDTQGDKRLVAYIVLTSSASGKLVQEEQITRQQEWTSLLRNALAENLPEYMIPVAFMLLDALPLTPNGKLDRQALPLPDLRRSELHTAYVAPSTLLEKTLTQIWSAILGIERVGTQDNFFDLGGDSIRAVRLVDRIRQQLDLHPSLTMLFKYPTIAQLALKLYEPEPESSLIPLATKRVHEQRIFLIHPLGGHIFCYNPLAQSFGSDFTIYGLQARGFDGKQPPYSRVEDMAAYYLQEIVNVQPEGPYIIGGWCMGGTVAFEVARQLHVQGRKLALTALISADADHPTDPRLADDKVEVLLYALGLLQVPMDESIVNKLDPTESTLDLIGQLQAQNLLPDTVDPERVRIHMKIYQTHARALLSYKPQPYMGKLVLFRPMEATPHGGEQVNVSGNEKKSTSTNKHIRGRYLGWDKLAVGGIDVIAIPGHHYSIMREPHVQALADALKAAIDQALLDYSS